MVALLPEMRNKSPKESGAPQSVSATGHAQKSVVTLGSRGYSGQGRLRDAEERGGEGAHAGLGRGPTRARAGPTRAG
jgi:hypothetical protein